MVETRRRKREDIRSEEPEKNQEDMSPKSKVSRTSAAEENTSEAENTSAAEGKASEAEKSAAAEGNAEVREEETAGEKTATEAEVIATEEEGIEIDAREKTTAEESRSEAAEKTTAEETTAEKTTAEETTAEETTAEEGGEGNKAEEVIEEKEDDGDDEKTESDEERGKEGEEEETAEELVQNGGNERRNSASSDEELRQSRLMAIKPSKMYFQPSEYKKQIKIGTRCNIADTIATLENLNPKLSNVERKWFEDHSQFKHFFHFAQIEKNHKVQGMWMLLLRTAETNKEKTPWFIPNGGPVRYGLREHTLISGLDCRNYPLDYEQAGGTKFVDRHFKKGEPRRLEDVKAKLVNMGPHKDRLRMNVLFFLGSVICGKTKVRKGAKNVLDFFQKVVDDLDFCKTFPWGRYSFEYMLKEITHTMEHFEGVVPDDRNTLWLVPGFCVPLEILAFEAIPKLGKVFREPVEGDHKFCPMMCKSRFKANGMRGMSLLDINKEMGHEAEIHTLIPSKTREEEYMLDDLLELDDDIDKADLAADSWETRVHHSLKIFFQDMFDADVEAREKETEETEEKEAARDGGDGVVEVGGVMKTLNSIVKMIKKVEKKVDELGSRLEPLEAFVKEAEKKKKK